jgi:hypothetical protein
MMQTHSASTDEDIGVGKESARFQERAVASALLALDHSGQLCTASSAKGCSDHADGLAPSISLAHGEGGPLGSHCATATYAALHSMPMTPARRRRFQRTTRSNARMSQRVNTQQELALLRSLPTTARCFGRTDVCRRRRSWMRIGNACGTGGSVDPGLAGGRASKQDPQTASFRI